MCCCGCSTHWGLVVTVSNAVLTARPGHMPQSVKTIYIPQSHTTGDPVSQSHTTGDPMSQRHTTDDPVSQRHTTGDPVSQRHTTGDPMSQRHTTW